MIEIKRGKGRPVKYKTTLERIEVRRIQNRINQRRFKRKRKLETDLSQLPSGKEFDKEYKEGILKYFNHFDYDYFFTGTFDGKKGERDYLKSVLEKLDLGNQYDEWLSNFSKPQSIGINGLRDYIGKYLDFLSSKKIFQRCFFVIEKGKKSKNHVHMMFKSNNHVTNFECITENSWLLGCSICLPIESEIDKSRMFEYCLKEVKPSSTIKSDQNIVDNWNFRGDFDNKKRYEYQTPKPIQPLETFIELV